MDTFYRGNGQVALASRTGGSKISGEVALTNRNGGSFYSGLSIVISIITINSGQIAVFDSSAIGIIGWNHVR